MLYYLAIWIVVPIFWLLYRPRILNLRRTRTKGRAVYVCNHFSLADPVILCAITPRFLHIMAKSDLFKDGIGRLFFKLLLAFPVARKTADLKSVKRAIRLIEKGNAFAIFPEGTRSKSGEILPLENGAAFIARHARSPIIPVYIHPSIWRRFKLRGAVGEPIDCATAIAACPEMKPDEAITAAIARALQELKTQVETDITRECGSMR